MTERYRKPLEELLESADDGDYSRSDAVKCRHGQRRISIAQGYYERRIALHVHARWIGGVGPGSGVEIDAREWCVMFECVGKLVEDFDGSRLGS